MRLIGAFVVGLFVGVAIISAGAQAKGDVLEVPAPFSTLPVEAGYLLSVFPGQPRSQKVIDHDAYIPLVRCINAKD